MSALNDDNDQARFTLYVHKRKHAKIYQFLQTLPDGSVANYLRDLVLEDIARRESTSRLPLDMTPAPPRRSRRTPPAKTAQVTRQPIAPPPMQTAAAQPAPEPVPYSPASAVTTPTQPAQAAVAYSPPPGPIAPPQPAPDSVPTVTTAPAQQMHPGADPQPPSADDLLTELLANF